MIGGDKNMALTEATLERPSSQIPESAVLIDQATARNIAELAAQGVDAKAEIVEAGSTEDEDSPEMAAVRDAQDLVRDFRRQVETPTAMPVSRIDAVTEPRS